VFPGARVQTLTASADIPDGYRLYLSAISTILRLNFSSLQQAAISLVSILTHLP